MIADLVIEALAFSCTETDRRLVLPAPPVGARGWQTEIITLQPGKIDAWQRFSAPLEVVCAHGMVKLVVFDERRDAGSFGELQELITGEYCLQHVHIPAGIFVGWQCISPGEATLHVRQAAGITIERRAMDSDFIPYQWTGTS